MATGQQQYGSIQQPEEDGLFVQWEAQVRNDFVKKVFTIVGTQLTFTALGILAMNYWFYGRLEDVLNSKKGPFDAEFVTRRAEKLNTALVISALCSIGTLSILCLGCCVPSVFRTSPINYIVLAFYTLFFTGSAALITLFYTPVSVIGAAATTGVLVLGLGIYAATTKTDFTGCGPYLFAFLLGIVAFMFVSIIIGAVTGIGQPLHYVIQGAFALIFSMYIVYDIQLIMGGKHRSHQFQEDDYVLAAIVLYGDIINLFLALLQLFGSRR